MSDRFYVSLSATCHEAHLHEVLDRMSAVMPQVADADAGTTVLDGLSLSFTRDDGDTFAAEVVPTALPVTPAPILPDAAPAPPPTEPEDAADGAHAAPEEQA